MSFPFLQRAAAAAPDALALEDGERSLSYGELARAADARRAALLEAPGEPRPLTGTVLPLIARGELETVVEVLASLEAGVPRGLLSDRGSEREQAELRALFAGARPDAPGAPDTALVVPTSGSSGSPRGVLLSARALEAAVAASAAHLGVASDEVWLCPLPLFHLGGLSIPLRAVAAGRPCILLRRFSPEDFIEQVEAARVTVTSLVPTLLRRLLSECPGWRPPSHLRAILLGGAGIDPATLRLAGERGYPVLPTYGLTETCGQVCTVRPGTPPDPVEGVGHPLPGLEVELDDEGRIRVRGATLLSGTLPDAPGSRPDSDGWFRSSDLGRLDSEGRLTVLGRADGVIVTGGEKVHPLEVEAALLEHPGVAAAGVVGLEEAKYGRVVAAGLVLRAGFALPEIEAFARDRLGGHRRPRRLLALEALPLTPSGKLDRRALAALLERVIEITNP